MIKRFEKSTFIGAPLVIFTNALGRNFISLVISNRTPDVRYKCLLCPRARPEENKEQKIQDKILVCSNKFQFQY